jgi:hypothetical protein
MKFKLSLVLVALMITAVGCGDDNPAAPTPGNLEIATVTTGENLDADGYELTIDGETGPAIGVNATVTREDVSPGAYLIQLGDVASNCTVQGDNPRTVDLAAGQTATTKFDVVCVGPPANQPPVADAGMDQTVVDVLGAGAVNVRLDGSGSSDADGTITSYTWLEADNEIATGEMPMAAFTVGVHAVTLRVRDDQNATDTDDVVITVDALPAPVSFAAQIQPYFEAGMANCVQCHNGGTGEVGVNLDSWANILTDGNNGPLVVPFDSADPLAILVPKLAANHNDGPDDAGFVVTLKQWIDEGALDN